jgi:hypothetical protein
MKRSLWFAAALIVAQGSLAVAAGAMGAIGTGALALKKITSEASPVGQVRDEKGKGDKAAKPSAAQTAKDIAGKLLAPDSGKKDGGKKGGDKDDKGKGDKAAKPSAEQTAKDIAAKLLAADGGKKGGDKKGGDKDDRGKNDKAAKPSAEQTAKDIAAKLFGGKKGGDK